MEEYEMDDRVEKTYNEEIIDELIDLISRARLKLDDLRYGDSENNDQVEKIEQMLKDIYWEIENLGS